MAKGKWTRPRAVRFSDIEQREWGTCYFLAVAPGNLKYQLKKRASSSNSTGTSSMFRFQYSDLSVSVRQISGESFTRTIERSYVKYKTLKGAPADLAFKDTIDGGFLSEAYVDITGKSGLNASTAMPLTQIQNWLKTGYSISLASFSRDERFVYAHGYRVLGATDSHISLWNPWGWDGGSYRDSNPADGVVTLSASEFLDRMPPAEGYFYIGRP